MSGVPITIPALPAVSPATADQVALWDTDLGIQGKSTLTNLGSVLALLTGATFTGVVAAPSINAFVGDNGAGGGGILIADNNQNVTTPAPGSTRMDKAVGGGSFFLFPDDSNILRFTTSTPTNANYATGNVIGTQTSSLDTKDVLGEALPAEEVLALIAEGAAAVRRFQYKAVLNPVYDNEGNETGEFVEGPRPYGGEEFSGVVVDFAGRYGTDRDAAHPNGKGLNTINSTGDLLIAVNYLAGRVAELEARLEAGVSGVSTALANFEEPPAEGAQ